MYNFKFILEMTGITLATVFVLFAIYATIGALSSKKRK